MKRPNKLPPNKLPLEGIRVLDLTMVVAGPYCTMLLADWGAEVIRLDTAQVFVPFTRGVMARPSKEYAELTKGSGYGYAGNDPGARPWNKHTMFQNHARNKHSMTVDLRQPEGRLIFQSLLAVSDVVVENSVPEKVERLGVTWDAVRKVRPDIIMLRMPPYGLEGQYRGYKAFGSHIEATVGHLWMRGYPDTDVSMRGVYPIADGPSGVGGALAVTLALRHRARTGQGQLIELSQTEHFATYMGEALIGYAMNRRDEPPTGNRHSRFAPHGCYPCRGEDKWVTIAVSTDDEWLAFQQVIGDPAWAADARFAANEGRVRHHDELDEQIGDWTRDRDHYDVMNLLQRAGVPAGAVIDEGEALDDPHLNARGFFERVTQEDSGTHRYPGLSFRMNDTPNAIRMPPCRLGEHNGYVYDELLAIPAEERASLERNGHITMDYAPGIR